MKLGITDENLIYIIITSIFLLSVVTNAANWSICFNTNCTTQTPHTGKTQHYRISQTSNAIDEIWLYELSDCARWGDLLFSCCVQNIQMPLYSVSNANS